jgi:hypothetical protein
MVSVASINYVRRVTYAVAVSIAALVVAPIVAARRITIIQNIG